MACSSDGTATDHPDFTKTKLIGKAIGQFVRIVLKMTKFQANKNVEAIIGGLTKYLDEIVRTAEGRQLLRSTKHLVSKIANKEAFLAVLWRIFNVARRISRNGSGKFGLFLMGAGLIIFFLLTVRGVGESALAVWLALAARTFAGRLLSTGSTLIRKRIKEAVPNKQALLTLLNTIVSSQHETQLLSDEEIRQLEVRSSRTPKDSYKDWIII